MGGPDPAEDKTDVMGGPTRRRGHMEVMGEPQPASEQTDVMRGPRTNEADVMGGPGGGPM